MCGFKKLLSFCLIASTILCAGSRLSVGSPKTDGAFIIWAHSDIQPRNEREKQHYRRAVDDIRKSFSTIDVAVFAGDIVQHDRFEELFAWFLRERQKAPVAEWHEIAGNHEWRAIGSYRRMINRRLHYAVEKGNILMLFMSNEKAGRRTWISDGTFLWWKEKVENAGDRIIITVTHGTLENNGLPASRLERLTIIDSGRFMNVLKRRKVDMWISAHSHFPGWLPGMHVANNAAGGTTFIDLGAIRQDILTTVESRIIIFRPESAIATLRYRDHVYGDYFDKGGYAIKLSAPFRR